MMNIILFHDVLLAGCCRCSEEGACSRHRSIVVGMAKHSSTMIEIKTSRVQLELLLNVSSDSQTYP